MEGYSSGNEYAMPLQAFEYIQITNGADDILGEYTTVFSVEPRIVAGELILRTRLWFLVSYFRLGYIHKTS